MLLERISQTVQQLVTMLTVVGGLRLKWRQSPLITDKVQPVATPGAVVQQAMEIGARDASTSSCL